MAKVASKSSDKKVSFGKSGKGKAKKKYGPRAERPKKYRGQGK